MDAGQELAGSLRIEAQGPHPIAREAGVRESRSRSGRDPPNDRRPPT
jgi:hypothetical protein